MWIVIICFPVDENIQFEINLNSLKAVFLYEQKKQYKIIQTLNNEKSFSGGLCE